MPAKLQSTPDDRTYAPPLLDRLVEFGLGLDFDDLTASVIDTVKIVLLDSFGCALAASDSEAAGIAGTVWSRLDTGNSVATAWGGSDKRSVARATLFNGALLRYHDYMDVYSEVSTCHPSECIPLAVASGERANRSGRELIATVAAAYELQVKLVDSVSFADLGLHHSTIAGLVTPIIIGRESGYNPGLIADAAAIGLAESATLGVVSQGQISKLKAFNYPLGVLASLDAIELAQAGLTGPPRVLESLLGTADPGPLVPRDDNLRLTEIWLKQYPVQFQLQSVVEACVAAHATLGGETSHIRSIEVRTTQEVSRRTADEQKYRPTSRETADHSLPYCAAVALSTGGITVDDFKNRTWEQPTIKDLMRLVKVVVAPTDDGDRDPGMSVRVNTSTRGQFTERVLAPRGHPRRPMSWEQVVEKFTRNAAGIISQGAIERLVEAVHELDGTRTVRELTRLLRAGTSTAAE